MNITSGDWTYSVDSETGMAATLFSEVEGEEVDIAEFEQWDDEDSMKEMLANAALIAEAGTVKNETGCTPQQLLKQRNDLLDACEMLVRNPIIASVQAPIKAHAKKEGLLNCMDLVFDAIAGATN